MIASDTFSVNGVSWLPEGLKTGGSPFDTTPRPKTAVACSWDHYVLDNGAVVTEVTDLDPAIGVYVEEWDSPAGLRPLQVSRSIDSPDGRIDFTYAGSASLTKGALRLYLDIPPDYADLITDANFVKVLGDALRAFEHGGR